MTIVILILLGSSGLAQDWTPPSYTVLRAATPIRIDGKLDEPAWFAAPAVGRFHFPWWTSGKKEGSIAKILWDKENLYIAHIAEDAHITARHKDHDGKVAEDDCFEIMILPDRDKPEVYFNIEWNVIGGYVDNFRPNGPNKPRAPVWDAEGVEIAGSYEGTLNDDSDLDRYWLVEVKIPLRNFARYAKHIPPLPGESWRINLNRHGGATNPQYSQWSPGGTPKPAFHTPHRFGKIIFSESTSPFSGDSQ
ncbi:MAG TPA: carbohydrate-binding family 9-like protein [Bryobacteraceae bacterium]|nr:carbohydrate-binding family 9-like protein [Bryobacteraceae bacterium]